MKMIYRKKLFLLILISAFLVSFLNIVSSYAQTEVEIQSLNSSLFPFIYSNVQVISNGNPVANLTKSDFEIYENDILQSEYFEVTPPQSGGGVRLADIVFLIDCSGSMGGEISDVRNNVINFADALQESSIDYRLGLVRFGYGNGNPYLFNGGNLTGDADQFREYVGSLGASGSYEPGLLAIQQAITGFNFRPGSQKIFLIITDEDSDAGNLETTINLLLANSVTVHAAVDCGSGGSQNHYCNSSSVRGSTGGLLFGVTSSYNDILETIVEQASSTYLVRYKSSNPIFDATVRTVEIFCTADFETDSDIASYIPGAAPAISLTEDTIALLSNPPAEGDSIEVIVNINDSAAPFVSSARLYYRTVNSLTYNILNLSNSGGNIWTATIPGGVVQYPGIELYITASDGQTSSSLPRVDPASNPITIAVLPNELPVIAHFPVFVAVSGQDLNIEALITDSTHYVETARLYYRRIGELQYHEIGYSVGVSSYSFLGTIPGSEITPFGFEYYLEAIDDLGASASFGTADNPIQIIFIAAESIQDGYDSGDLPPADNLTSPPGVFKTIHLLSNNSYEIVNASINDIDNSKSTAIVVHGWNQDGSTDLPSWTVQIAKLAKINSNVLIWEWLEQANTGPVTPPTDSVMQQQAYLLSKSLLEDFIVPINYLGKIHFIGHSAGARVSYSAVNLLVDNGIPIDLLTILDAYMFNFTEFLDDGLQFLTDPVNYLAPTDAILKAFINNISSNFKITPVTKANFFDNYWALIGGATGVDVLLNQDFTRVWALTLSSMFQGVDAMIVDEILCTNEEERFSHEVPENIKEDYYLTGFTSVFHKPPVNWYMASMIDQLGVDAQGDHSDSHQYGYYWSPSFNNSRPNRSDIQLLTGCENYYDLFGSSQIFTDAAVKIGEGIEAGVNLVNSLYDTAVAMGRTIVVIAVDTLESTTEWAADQAESLYHGVTGAVKWIIAKTGSPVSFSKVYQVQNDVTHMSFYYEIIEADSMDSIEVFVNNEKVEHILAKPQKDKGVILSDWIDLSKLSGNAMRLTFRINSVDGAPLIIKIYDVVFAKIEETEDLIIKDFDYDGLPDLYEIIFWSNLEQAGSDDSDSDGLTNGEELTLRTNPTNEDSDHDGIFDGLEIELGFDPNDSNNAPEGIEYLAQIILSLDIQDEGVENGLLDKANEIKNKIDKGKYNAAINQLQAFINQVNAQRGHWIAEEDADMMVQYATNIINLM